MFPFEFLFRHRRSGAEVGHVVQLGLGGRRVVRVRHIQTVFPRENQLVGVGRIPEFAGMIGAVPIGVKPERRIGSRAEVVEIRQRYPKSQSLSENDMKTALSFIEKYALEIVKKWIDFFVLKKKVKKINIKDKL